MSAVTRLHFLDLLQARAQNSNANANSKLSDIDALRLDEAQRVRATSIKQNLERKLEVTQKPLHPTEAKALADATATLGRPRPGNTNPDVNADADTNVNADTRANGNTDTDAKAHGETDTDTDGNGNANVDTHATSDASLNGNTDTHGDSNTDPNAASPTSDQQQPSPFSDSGSGKQPSTTVNNSSSVAEPRRTDGQPSSRSPSGRPSRPPLSVEGSRRLIANVMARPPHARQHPTVQTDLAQAQAVVDAAEAKHSPSAVESRWKQSSAPLGTAQRAAADKWHAELKAMRNTTNPVSAEDAISWKPHDPVSPDLKHKIFSATQTFLDMLSRDLVEALGPINVCVTSSLDTDVPGQYHAGSNTLYLSQQYIASCNSEDLRALVWHEMAHWLYFSADLDLKDITKQNPRTTQALKSLKAWRLKIDGHWHVRTLNQPIHQYPGSTNGSKSWSYILDGWIKIYAGRLYPEKTGGIEIPSVYLEEASYGPDKLADWCEDHPSEKETFDIVLSIFAK